VAKTTQKETTTMQFTTFTPSRTTTPTAASPVAASHRKLGASLWVVQGLLAATFLMAGVMKLVMPADQLTEQTDLSATFLRFIGVCEALGGVGLILPALLKIRTGLTPLAASGLVIIMIGATVLTAAAGDPGPAIFPFAIGILAAVVAWGRWTQATITSRH
jgi:uncharacterized membrane protein YphA (DoxX/SURF4 family)